MREDFKTIRRLRYPIPDVIDPPDTTCIVVRVPNNIGHIAAFWGQLFALTRWYAWEADEDHSGALLAEVWRQVYEAAREENCMNYIVRQHPSNSCELQRSFDGGTVWETWADLYSCGVRAAQDTFGTNSDNGASHTQPGEQPGGADPAPGQCFDLDLTVQANGMTLIPLAIKDNWRLSFTQVKGAWNDGNIGHDWVCPQGKAFFFGQCSALTEPTDAADPLNTLPHMKLIMRLPSGTYVEIPLDGTDYVVPAGQPDGNTFLLPNDSVLSDNQGSVSLHLLACNSDIQCFVHDFALSDCEFIPGGYTYRGADPAGRVMGTYDGTKWNYTDLYVPAYNYTDRAVSISRLFADIDVQRVEIDYDYEPGSPAFGVGIFSIEGHTFVVTTTISGTNQTLVWDNPGIIHGMAVQAWPFGGSGSVGYGNGAIRRIRYYVAGGAGPEGTTPC